MPSWAWVVTSFFQTFWLLLSLFQCPHRLELLPNNYDEILEINLFQCPHGLELLQENIRKTKRQLRVSMPLWAWVVTSWKEYIWHLKLFQCPYGLELLRNVTLEQYIIILVSMPLWAWVVTGGSCLLLTYPSVSMPLWAWVVTDNQQDRNCSSWVSMPLWAWVVTPVMVLFSSDRPCFNALMGLSCYKSCQINWQLY